jgi:hypothetical protein
MRSVSDSPTSADPPTEDAPTETEPTGPTPEFHRQEARHEARREALKLAAGGGVALGVNVICMWHDGEYYPLLMLGVPFLLVGLAALLFPLDYAEWTGFWSRNPNKITMPGSPGTPEPGTFGQAVLVVAVLGGLALGIYLAINPTAVLGWFTSS